MDIVKSTKKYEEWLGGYMPIVTADLQFKHEQMASETFPFFRATYYRWAQVWAKECKEVADAPVVFSVGDLHMENFGTWRDREGRMVWGVNDLDEADRLPYTVDLVRLSASALLAAEAGRVGLGRPEAVGAVLGGYTRGIE